MLVGLLALAVNLRVGLTEMTAITPIVVRDLGLTGLDVSLVTFLPVVTMGLFAMVVPAIAVRVDRSALVSWSLILLAVGLAARSVTDSGLWLHGTAIIVGVGIGLGQTMLARLADDFQSQFVGVMALATVALNLGGAAANYATVALTNAAGSWRIAAGSWFVLALVGLVVWHASRPGRGIVTSPGSWLLPVRARSAWALTVLFAYVASVYAVITAWGGVALAETGYAEDQIGLILAGFNICQVVGTGLFMAGTRAVRRLEPWLFLGTSGVIVLLLVGSVQTIVLAAWLLGGLAMGVVFTACLAGTVALARRDGLDNIAAMTFGFGYMTAAIAPVLVAMMVDRTASLASSFALLGVGGLLLLVWYASAVRRGADMEGDGWTGTPAI